MKRPSHLRWNFNFIKIFFYIPKYLMRLRKNWDNLDMKYFQPLPIETFVSNIIADDREVTRIIENWNIEREEIAQILVNHFKSLGIYLVKPLDFAVVIRKNILFQLRYNPSLKLRIVQIAREIEKVKTKHTRHAS